MEHSDSEQSADFRSVDGERNALSFRHDILSKLTTDDDIDDEEKLFLIQLVQFPHKFATFNPVTNQRKNGRFRGEILVGMMMAQDLGLNPFRNETSPQTSACDAVALAFFEIGFKPTSYSGVKAIFLRNSWNSPPDEIFVD
jgi:hypothetical protein